MGKGKRLTELPDTYIVHDIRFLMNNWKTNVSPPYSAEELQQIRTWEFEGVQFLQTHGFLNRIVAKKIESIDDAVIRNSDLTSQGKDFYDDCFSRYLSASGRDFTKDPKKAVKRILERGLPDRS